VTVFPYLDPPSSADGDLCYIISGISRTSLHKRSATGAQRAHYRKKRKFELGRQPANTKLGTKRIHTVRVRGGNLKFRALRLDSGNFAWASESVTRKTRIIGVVSTGDPI
jgi:small subunit ribosomal protein S8e